MKKFVLKASTVATITAICAAFSGFMFGCLSLHFMIERHDLMLIPFVLSGFIGSAVMWTNRK